MKSNSDTNRLVVQNAAKQDHDSLHKLFKQKVQDQHADRQQTADSLA